MNFRNVTMPVENDALPGRSESIAVAASHFVNNNPLASPFPDNMDMAMFGLGCFWGAEKIFWKLPGVFVTAVGYAAGFTPNPMYDEVCSGMTGHNEVVLVVFDPAKVSYEVLLGIFWESHNPGQGMRQGNDVGTQYRSGIYFYNESQEKFARISKIAYQKLLEKAGYDDAITTEIISVSDFYYAEDYHQQYLAKNPNGYCGLGGTGIRYSHG